MKKLFSLAVLLAVLALGLTACKENPETPSEDNREKLDDYRSAYLMDRNGYRYQIKLFTAGTLSKETETILSDGCLYSFDLVLERAPIGGTMPNGVYNVRDMKRDYIYVLPYTTSGIGEYRAIREGTLTVESDKVTLQIKDSKGKTHEAIYNSSMKVKSWEDMPYELESKTPTDVNITFAEVKYARYSDYENSGKRLLWLDLTNADKDWAHLGLYTNIDDNYNGVYQINSSLSVGTASASSGYDGEEFTISIIHKSRQYVEMVTYFLASGTITITDSGITINAKSHFGSTINTTYSGTFTATP